MMPVSVAGLARKKGAYLVALRKPGSSIGGCWEFPGGKAEDGEDTATALKREMLEEFGIRIRVGKLAYTGRFENKGAEYELFAYDMKPLGKPRLREHDSLDWKSPAELKLLPMADSDRAILKSLLND